MRVTQTGLLVNDDLHATPVLTLFSPLRSSTAYLLNMAGETVHEWHLGDPCGGLVYLIENGNLLYIGWEAMPADKAARVQGGIAGTEHPDVGIYGDYLKEVTPSGETFGSTYLPMNTSSRMVNS